jgi:hypothetical protein
MSDNDVEDDIPVEDEAIEEELDEEELDDDALEDDDDDIELADDADLPLDEVAEVAAVEGTEVPVGATVPTEEKPKETEGEDEDVLDLDEELHPDDVEVPLDALLKERTAAATLEDDEEEVEEDEPDVDERGETPAKIVPRRPGEFLCSSCFLVLPRNQLADEERMLCRDCA